MQTVENHTIANELYDILLATAKEQINKKDYYSAIKTLDTLGNYCSLMPENFCKATHTDLKTIAIQGIYNAYFDVIRQAIRNNCFVLSINYLQGLELVMENNGDSLQANNTFQDVFNQLFKKYSQSTNQKKLKNNTLMLFPRRMNLKTHWIQLIFFIRRHCLMIFIQDVIPIYI